MGFELGGHPKKSKQAGPSGPSVGSFTLGGSHHGGPAPASTFNDGGGRGVLGTIGHVVGQAGSDIGSAATGFLPGVAHTAQTVGEAFVEDAKKLKHPLRTQSLDEFLHGKEGSARRKLGDLEKGVAKQTGNDLVRPFTHPTDPHLGNFALSALTVASGGAGAAERAAAAGKALKAGEGLKTAARTAVSTPARAELPIRSPKAVATGSGPVATKLSETQPLVKGRQVLTNKALARIKYTRPVVGEGARYGKEVRRTAVREGLKEMPAYRTYVHATKKLNDHEWAALNLIPRDVRPADLAEYWKGTKNGEVAADPAVARLVEKPTKRLQAAVEAARQLSEQGGGIFKDLGMLKDETAATRPGVFRERVAEKLGRPVEPLHGSPFYVPDVPRPTKAGDPFAAFGGGKGIPRTPGSAKENKGILQSLGKLNLKEDVLGPNFLSRVKLKTHTAIHDGLLNSAMKLTPQELDLVLAEHGGVPKGWEYLRAPVVGKTGAVRSQRVSGLKQLEGDTAATPESISNLLKSEEALTRRLSEPVGTHDKTLAFFDGQHYFLSPSNTIKAATGEFHRSNAAVRYLIEKPLSAWRSIVLGLRLGFLTNNVVGNQLLYSIRSAGVGGLRAYLHAVQEAKGPDVVRQLLEDAPTRAKLGDRVTKQLMDEFFPEQVQGTFGRTQSPITESAIPTKARKLGQKAQLGVLPATQSIAETIPRRALAEVLIRRSPEFRAVYQAMPKQTRTFEGAARRTLEQQGPAYQRLISDQINRAMGDYLNQGTFERHVLRNVLPFVSWYKAIATITAHLAADTPGRALAVQQLGQIGSDYTNETLGELPSYLKGAIPLSGTDTGTPTVLSTQGLNPFSTLPQLGRGFSMDVGELGLSPFIQLPLETYARSRQYGGRGIGLPQLLGQSAADLAAGLPLARVLAPAPPSRLYPKRNRLSEVMGFAGVPVKKPRLSVAREYAREGR